MAVQYEIVETQEIDSKGRKRVVCNGVDGWMYPNGSIQHAKTGFWIKPPDDIEAATSRLQPVRNSESANRLNYIRWHGPRQAQAARVVAECMSELDRRPDDPLTIDKADAYIIGELVRAVLDPKIRLDHRVKAYEFVLKQSGMSGEPPKTGDNDTNTAQAAAIGAGTAVGALFQLIQELQKRAEPAQSGDVIDAE